MLAAKHFIIYAICTGLPDAFCENTDHFVNSVASTVICVVSVTGKKTTSIVKPQ